MAERLERFANVFTVCQWRGVKSLAERVWSSVDFCVTDVDSELLCRLALMKSAPSGDRPKDTNPSAVEDLLEESMPKEVRSGLQGVCLFFVVSGRESGIPESVFPVVSEIAQAFNSLSIGVAIRPFDAEGDDALQGEALTGAPDEKSPKEPGAEADLHLDEDVLLNFVGEIVDLVQEIGRGKLDFNDIPQVWRKGMRTDARAGYDSSERLAAKRALAAMLLERHDELSDSHGILFIVSTSETALRPEDLCGAANAIKRHIPVCGLCHFNQTLGKGVRVVAVSWRPKPEHTLPPIFPNPDDPPPPGGMGQWYGAIKDKNLADCVASPSGAGQKVA